MHSRETYALLNTLGIGTPDWTIFEIGVHAPASSQIHEFISRGYNVTMFEPLPGIVAAIKADYPDARVENVAIGDENGEAEFVVCGHGGSEGASSHLRNPPYIAPGDCCERPGTVGESPHDTIITVQVRKISEYDTGNLNMLVMDAEGAEWFAIKHLISRPDIITVEMYSPGIQYTNPFEKEIREWMVANNYTQYFLSRGEDAVFVKDFDTLPNYKFVKEGT